MGEPCVTHPDGGYRNGHELLAALAARQRAPVAAHLQVADRCNHACAHCYQVQGQRGELSFEGLCEVLDRLASAGVLMLNVSGGEATLRTDLVAILREARRRGFALRLYTNAFLVDDRLAGEIAEVGVLEVHVSLYSDVAGDHDAVTRVPGSWEPSRPRGEALRGGGVRVVLKAPATWSPTPRGAQGVERISSGAGVRLHRQLRDVLAKTASRRSRSRPDPDALVRDGCCGPGPPERIRTRCAQEDRRRVLRVGTKSLVVLSNGDVQACTDTPLLMGNLASGSWDDVLASPDLPLFHSLTWGDVHGCRDCDLLGACARCHASALHEAGDYLGPYAGACARARARYGAGAGGLEVLAPAEGCAADRSALVGPYRIEAPGVLRPIPDVVTAEDEARAQRHPWIRRGEGAPQARLVSLRLGRDRHPP
ncbi:MAG: radical SAM/SPASM domain-containing protein [Polyangiales bacterium]